MKIEITRLDSLNLRVYMRACCKAFSHEAACANDIMCDLNADYEPVGVSVYDSIAGHYTTCCSLTRWHIDRIYKAAVRAMREAA